MFSVRCKFYPGDVEAAKYEDLIAAYLGSLVQNGQVIGKDWNIARADGCIEYSCIVPEEDTLSRKHGDAYVAKRWNELVAESRIEPEFLLIGSTLYLDDVCECDTSNC